MKCWSASCDKQTCNNNGTEHRGAGRVKHNCRQMKRKFAGWDEGRHRGTDTRRATTVITDTDVNKSHCIMQHMGLLHLCTHTCARMLLHISTHTHFTLNECIYAENVFPAHRLCLEDAALRTESHNSLWSDNSSVDGETENKEARYRREQRRL